MSACIRIIRHGEASSSPGGAADPSLTLRGVRQAFDLPRLVTRRPSQLLTSPLIRARETAMPLSAALEMERLVVEPYGELPWRDGQTVVDRTEDLADMLAARWPDLRQPWREWREKLIERALSERGDVVVVSHFVAINVLVGFACGDDRTVVVRPANASITEIVIEGGKMRVASLGDQIPETSPLSPSTGN